MRLPCSCGEEPLLGCLDATLPATILHTLEPPRASIRLLSAHIGRHGKIERFMRALVVIDRPPAIEGTLAMGEIGEALAAEHLGLERAVKALVLSLGLRVIRPAMGDLYPQAQQPDAECGMAFAARIAPWRAVVHEHGQWQAVAAKDLHQLLADSAVLLIGTGRKSQRIARMVVKHGERMTAAAADRKVALEIHLPQIIGCGPLEAPMRAGVFGAALLKLAVPAQDRRDRACRRHLAHAAVLQNLADLAAAPGVVALTPDAQHLRFHRLRRALGARMRPARLVAKSRAAVRPIPGKPFVTRLAADPEPPAQLAQVRSLSQRQSHKLFPLLHDRQLPPWHCG